jgi:Lon protease-like protein
MSQLLPLFPLQLVVFPGSAIPLHIFEERYKEMVHEAETKGTEFGIVLARENGIVNAGCTVVVETVLRRYPDGRSDIITRGKRRFEIVSIDQEKDYLRGEVQYFDDEVEAAVEPELRSKAVQAFERIQRAIPDAKSATANPQHPLLSFELAQVVEDLDFQNMLQRSRSEAERLRMFTDFADAHIERRLYAEKMKHGAPLNGFGHMPAGASH